MFLQRLRREENAISFPHMYIYTMRNLYKLNKSYVYILPIRDIRLNYVNQLMRAQNKFIILHQRR